MASSSARTFPAPCAGRRAPRCGTRASPAPRRPRAPLPAGPFLDEFVGDGTHERARRPAREQARHGAGAGTCRRRRARPRDRPPPAYPECSVNAAGFDGGQRDRLRHEQRITRHAAVDMSRRRRSNGPVGAPHAGRSDDATHAPRRGDSHRTSVRRSAAPRIRPAPAARAAACRRVGRGRARGRRRLATAGGRHSRGGAVARTGQRARPSATVGAVDADAASRQGGEMAPQRRQDQLVGGRRALEAHLELRGMHVDVDLARRRRQEQHRHRIAAAHQERFVAVERRAQEQPIAHPTARPRPPRRDPTATKVHTSRAVASDSRGGPRKPRSAPCRRRVASTSIIAPARSRRAPAPGAGAARRTGG